MIFYTHTMHKRRHVISLPLHTASLHTASLPGILAGIRTATKSCLKITLLVSLAFLPGIFSVLLPIISSPQAYATSGAVTTPSVDITSFAAGASQVTYKISFSVSSTGGLAGGQGTIDLIAPSGTVWPTKATNYEVEDQTTASASGPASGVSIADNGTVAVITVPDNINNSDSLTMKVLGVTNPVAVGSYTIGVQTSSDPALVESTSYTIVSATSVSNPTATYSTTSANATGVSYYITFTLSNQGQLVGGQSTITLTAPEGTVWPSNCQAASGSTGFVITDETNSLDSGTPIACSIAGSIATLTVRSVIPASTSSSPSNLEITASGVTNPPSGSNDSIGISTSSDTQIVQTNSQTIEPYTSISGLNVIPSTYAAGAHGVHYNVWFNTSSEGELIGGQGSISMSFPGAWWPTTSSQLGGDNEFTLRDYVNGLSQPYITNSFSGGSISPQAGGSGGITITVPYTLQASQLMELRINGMINPPAGTVPFTLSTSTDQAAASFPVQFGAPNAVLNFASSINTTSTGTAPNLTYTTTYTLTFNTSSTGTLEPNIGNITVISSDPIFNASYCLTDTTGNMIYASNTSFNSTLTPSITTLTIGAAQGNPNTASGASFCSVASNTAPAKTPPIAAGDGVQVQLQVTYTATTIPQPPLSPTFGVETSSDTVAPSILQPAPPSSGSPTVTVDPSTSSSSMASYAMAFTATTALANSSGAQIEVVFPQGTMLTNCSQRVIFTGYCPSIGYNIQDITTSSGSGSGTIQVGANDTTALITLNNPVNQNDNLILTIGPLQNPPAGSMQLTLITCEGYCSTGTGPSGGLTTMSSQPYTITAASSVSTPQVSLSTPAANATGVTYSITFQVSQDGALPGKNNLMGQASTIALTADAGTIWPSNQSDYTYIDHTAQSPRAPLGADGLNVLVANNGTSVGQIVVPKSVSAGDTLTLVIADVTNPPVSTSNVLTVSTSSDTIPSISAPYTTTAPQALSSVSVSATSTVASAVGVTYKIAFTTSTTGHLSGGQSSIYLTASAGTILPTSNYSITDNTTPSGSGMVSSVSAFGSSAVITPSNSISSGDSIVLTISGVSNPVSVGSAPLYIYTSSDLIPVVYNSFSITKGGSPVNPVIYMSSATPSKTGVNYTINFNTSTTGALGTSGGGSGNQGSSITVTAPALTDFSSASFIIEDDSGGPTNTNGTPTGPVSAGPSSQITVSGGFAVATMYISANIAASSTVTIQISSVTNAPAPGTFYVSTSSDPVPTKVSILTISTPTVTTVSPPSGSTSGGYNVAVGGTGMSLITQVSFGGTAASFTITSATALVAIAPQGSPGEIDITATNPAGTSATGASDKFTYVASSPPTSPADYVPVSPMRLADTRCGATLKPSFCAGEKLPTQNSTLTTIASDNSIDVTVTGVDGIPTSGTTAVALNVTMVNPVAKGGFLAVYPASSSGSIPTISNINWSTAGANIPNLVMVEVGQNNQVTIYNGSGGTVNATVDIEGYYSTTASTASTYNPVSPVRLADTRCSLTPKPSFCTSSYIPSQNATLKTLAPLAQENVAVAGIAGIPSNASAVVLNVTMANTTSAGFLTVWPTGKTRAVVSNLNWAAGKDVANRVVVPVGNGGDVSLYNGSGGSGNFIVDISGYYAPSSSNGSQFSAVSPIRICDTRSPSITGYTTECSAKGYLPSGGTMLVQVTGIDGIPSSGISAVVANVTAAGSTAAGGYLSVLPGGTAVSASHPPTISDLNWSSPEENVANLVVAKLGSGGTIEIFNSAGDTKVIVDVMGWYS